MSYKWKRIGRTDDNPAGLSRYIDTGTDLYLWCHSTSGRRQWRWNFQWGTVKWNGMRVNKKDLDQAADILVALFGDGVPAQNTGRTIHLYGFSRGGAVAVIIGIIVGVEPRSLIAPKRAGRKLPTYTALHFPGDVVPFFPPWYTSYDLRRMSDERQLPWNAHREAGKRAARERRYIETAINAGARP